MGSTTNLSLQAGYDWPTLNWTIGTNLGFSKFWGPGAQDSLDGLNVGALTTSLQRTTPYAKLTNYNVSFSGSVLPSQFTEVLDSGVTNADTKTVSYSAQAGLTHQLNELNALAFSTSWSSQSFINNGSGHSLTNNGSGHSSAESDALHPNTYVTMGPSWIHSVTPLTSLTLAASTDWYTAEGVGSTDSVSESLTLQMQTQPSERWNLSAGGGGNVIFETSSSDPTLSDSSGSTSTGFIANAAISYAPVATTTVSAFASHDLAPSSLGSVQESTQVGLNVGHQINGISSVSFGSAFVSQLPVFFDSNQNQQHEGVILSVGYQRNLTRDWNFSLGYSFSAQNNGDSEFFQTLDNEGSSTSNAVFATISRSFNLLSPTEAVAPQDNANWMRGGGAWSGRRAAWAANQPLLAPQGVAAPRVTPIGSPY